MNFTDFSFWWLLLLVGGGLLALRAAALRLRIWRDPWDRLVLACLSLTLFYNASPASFIIFLGEIGFNYAVLRQLDRSGPNRATLLALAIVVDLGVLIYFKYLEFLFGDFIAVLSFGMIDRAQGALAQSSGGIPPGISFYTFEMLSIVIDAYRSPRRIRALDYLNFIAFFPHLVAGPIQRRTDLLPQLEGFRIRFDPAGIDHGVRWLAFGIFLKTVLADNLAPLIDLTAAESPLQILLGVYLFGLRIYFDFAGYSFIGLGIAAILGVELTVNFMAPYVARNSREFWTRWHVTLSRWFRDYLYIPLGGGRVKYWALNLMIVFTISGLWHGAGWNFVLWGAYHGLLLVFYRLWEVLVVPMRRVFGLRGASWERFVPSGWLLMYPLAMFGWLFFMETDWSRLITKLGVLVDPGAWVMGTGGGGIQMERVQLAQFAIVFGLAHCVLLLEHVAAWRSRDAVYALLTSRPVAAAMLVLTFLLQARAKSPFIYFAF